MSSSWQLVVTEGHGSCQCGLWIAQMSVACGQDEEPVVHVAKMKDWVHLLCFVADQTLAAKDCMLLAVEPYVMFIFCCCISSL